LRHGVPCVRHQVYQDLIQLPRIDNNDCIRSIQIQPQLDILGDQPRQHFFDICNDFVDNYRPWGDDLLSGEGKKPVGQIGCPISRFNDLVGI
jgi:hypothetical protein